MKSSRTFSGRNKYLLKIAIGAGISAQDSYPSSASDHFHSPTLGSAGEHHASHEAAAFDFSKMKTPLSGRFILLEISAGRIRTYDQSVTRVLLFPKGVDYIIIRQSADARRFAFDCSQATPLRDSLYTFPSTMLGAWLGIAHPSIFSGLGFPRIHLVFQPKLLSEAA